MIKKLGLRWSRNIYRYSKNGSSWPENITFTATNLMARMDRDHPVLNCEFLVHPASRRDHATTLGTSLWLIFKSWYLSSIGKALSCSWSWGRDRKEYFKILRGGAPFFNQKGAFLSVESGSDKLLMVVIHLFPVDSTDLEIESKGEYFPIKKAKLPSTEISNEVHKFELRKYFWAKIIKMPVSMMESNDSESRSSCFDLNYYHSNSKSDRKYWLRTSNFGKTKSFI